MSKSIIGSMLEANVFLRVTALLVTFFFLFTFYAPIAMAAHDALESKTTKRHKAFNNHYSDFMHEFKQRMSRQKKHMDGVEVPSWLGSIFSADDSMMTQEMDEMLSMKSDLINMDNAAMQEFDQVKAHLEKHHMTDVIMQRHEEAVTNYKQKFSTMMTMMDGMNQAESDSEQREAIEHMHAFMQKQQFKRSHQPFDPKNLPFRSMRNKVRKPFTETSDLQNLLFPQKPVMVAASTLPAGLLANDTLGEEPTEDDLAETIDAQITPEIRALAETLEKSPIKIYTWVYNNIRYIPSYGSIQGSQQTLMNRRGNDMDTASLLIALLRASDIPARYVYGTVDIPADRAMNWVGGVHVPEAAVQLFGQGGVPVVTLTKGGKIVALRIEHVWVEAFIDFEPSRGVVNRRPDTWVPLDASYKQYVFTDGMDLSQVPFDVAAFEQAVLNGTEVKEEEGSVTGFPKDEITLQLQAYQSQVDEFIMNQNSDATVEDIIGTSTLKLIPARPLNSTLPYKPHKIGSYFSEIPDHLRYRFIFTLFDQFGGEVYSINRNTAELAGKKLAHSFSPTSQEDIDMLRNGD